MYLCTSICKYQYVYVLCMFANDVWIMYASTVYGECETSWKLLITSELHVHVIHHNVYGVWPSGKWNEHVLIYIFWSYVYWFVCDIQHLSCQGHRYSRTYIWMCANPWRKNQDHITVDWDKYDGKQPDTNNWWLVTHNINYYVRVYVSCLHWDYDTYILTF